MLRTLATLHVFVFLLVCTAPGFAADLKVGIIDMQRIIEKSEPGQKAMDQLKNEFTELKSKLDTKKAEIDKLRQAIQKQSVMLSQEAKTDKELEFKRKVRDFQDMYKAYQNKMQAKEKELSAPIIQKLAEVIDAYGDKHNYSFIMDKRNSGLVYGSNALEITEKIMVELNKAWRNQQQAE